MNKPTIISGIKPTGDLHLGNYLGMLRQSVELQNSSEYEAYYFIADYHAMTQAFTKEEMQSRVMGLTADLIASGLDPEKSTIFIQSQIPEHANLAWILNCLTSMGELTRMVEYKEKVAEGHVPNAGLFNYPVLMAADILLYNAEFIPVGEDQRQHIELARTIARTFNSKYADLFIEPRAVVTKTPRVMSLADPDKKMSKSQPAGCVFIHDSPEIIKKKVMSAVTDSEGSIAYNPEDRPGISNLVLLMSEFERTTTDEILKRYEGKKYAEFKSDLVDSIINTLKPIQIKREALLKDNAFVLESLEKGRLKAQKIATSRFSEIRKSLGLI